MDHSLPSRIPPLEPLRTFEVVARLGSFSAAAAALNMTHGAASRQIARLERWTGSRLFDRWARGVRLTPEGSRLLERTQQAFQVLTGSDRWLEPRGSAVVRLTAIPSVCARWLMPRLRDLEAGEPPLRILLTVDVQRQDLEADSIDLAIRCGRGAHAGRVSLQMFEEHCFPIAAPAVARRLAGSRPDALLQEALIHDSDASGWRAWFAAQGLDYRPRPGDRRFEDYSLVVEAARNGLGVALARPPLVGALLDRGELVRLSDETALNPVSYWLDRPVGAMRPAARVLASRIAAAAGIDPARSDAFLGASARGGPPAAARL